MPKLVWTTTGNDLWTARAGELVGSVMPSIVHTKEYYWRVHANGCGDDSIGTGLLPEITEAQEAAEMAMLTIANDVLVEFLRDKTK